PAGDRQFDGLIDEPAIYGRALDPMEVQAIYSAGRAGKCAPETCRGAVLESSIELPSGSTPQEGALDPPHHRAYVSSGAPVSAVYAINVDSGALEATIAAGDSPWGIARNPATGRIYVANQRGGGVSVIDSTTNSVVSTIVPSIAASWVSVDP